MWLLSATVMIKLPFEESVHQRVQVEGETGGAGHTEATIHVEAAGAFQEQIDLRPADPIRLRGAGLVQITSSDSVAPAGHAPPS